MEDYTEFVSFNILGDKVDVLCTETVYGTSVFVEIEGKPYYIGLIQEHIESGRMSPDIDMVPNLGFATIAWQEYYGRLLSEEDIMSVAKDNLNASIKINSK